eukprot:4663243-Alexandrium_andersonii.AAC.1
MSASLVGSEMCIRDSPSGCHSDSRRRALAPSRAQTPANAAWIYSGWRCAGGPGARGAGACLQGE